MSSPQFIKPYPNGYEDGEIGNTPVTAAILNTNYDGFLLALNEFLPELEGMVEANPSEAATAGNLTKLKVGNSIYLVPSGGSGGSTVEWEQIQLTGTKIATITINNVPINVYAPSGGGSGDEVSWTSVLGSGTKIGTITINGNPTDVYAPTPIDVEANPSGTATAGDLTKLKVRSNIYSIPSGGHTIIDENGNSMTARAGLQFVGGANVSDDDTDDKTIVDLASAGGIDGVFIDTENVIQVTTQISASGLEYTATEDCIVYIYLWGGNSTAIKINDYYVAGNFSNDKDVYLIPLKKGQTLTTTSGNALNTYTVYGIQTGTTHSKFQPVIYSLEEREIGVWTDGKPLYEKTLNLSKSDFIKVTTGIYQFTSHGISNIDKIIDIDGILKTSSFGIVKLSGKNYSSNTSDSASVELANYYNGVMAYDRGQSVLNNDANWTCNLIYRYTKTTDTAGSGSWTPQGVPAHHYSTDEHIVGTWIDGKTLYEKSISGVSITSGTQWIDLNIDDSNNIKAISGVLYQNNGFSTTLPSADSSAQIGLNVISDTIITDKWAVLYRTENTDARGTADITIQYTKSS